MKHDKKYREAKLRSVTKEGKRETIVRGRFYCDPFHTKSASQTNEKCASFVARAHSAPINVQRFLHESFRFLVVQRWGERSSLIETQQCLRRRDAVNLCFHAALQGCKILFAFAARLKVLPPHPADCGEPPSHTRSATSPDCISQV